MSKPLVLILALVMLFTTSCAIKSVLLDYLEVERPIPAKAFTTFQTGSSVPFSALCAAKTGSLMDEAEMLSPDTVKIPFLLFLGLFLLPWMIFRAEPGRKQYFAYSHFSFLNNVPIYLKYGRLVYYS